MGLFGTCLPCCFPPPNKEHVKPEPAISYNSDTVCDPVEPEGDPVDMESVYESHEDSRKKKEEAEDLKSVIRHAKLSAGNRAIKAHRVDTENNQSPPI